MRTLLFGFILLNIASLQAQKWQPAKVSLKTKWGKEVTPANAWTEYPRPQMKRKEWMSLNGLWNYTVSPKGQPAPSKFEAQILVPFCIESSLSGVGKPLLPTQELWYNREFKVPANWSGKDLILHFDAGYG
jgi:hypothetical protein